MVGSDVFLWCKNGDGSYKVKIVLNEGGKVKWCLIENETYLHLDVIFNDYIDKLRHILQL